MNTSGVSCIPKFRLLFFRDTLLIKVHWCYYSWFFICLGQVVTFRTQRFKKCTGAFASSNIPVWVLLKLSFFSSKQMCKFHSKARFGPIYGKIVGHSLHNMDQGGIFARRISSTSLYMMIFSEYSQKIISMLSNDDQPLFVWWSAYYQMIIILGPCPHHLSSNSEDKVYLCLLIQCEDNSW